MHSASVFLNKYLQSQVHMLRITCKSNGLGLDNIYNTEQQQKYCMHIAAKKSQFDEVTANRHWALLDEYSKPV